jgi:hypothetical protein
VSDQESPFHVGCPHLLNCCRHGLDFLVVYHFTSSKLDVMRDCHDKECFVYEHDVGHDRHFFISVHDSDWNAMVLGVHM